MNLCPMKNHLFRSTRKNKFISVSATVFIATFKRNSVSVVIVPPDHHEESSPNSDGKMTKRVAIYQPLSTPRLCL